MAPRIFSRRQNPPTNSNYLAGGLIAGAIVFIALLCLLCFRHRRSKAKRNAPHFHLRGAVEPMTAVTYNHSSKSVPPPFCRSRITASIIMPEKSITRKQSSSVAWSEKTSVSSKRATPSPAPSTLSIHRPPPSAPPTSPRPHTMSILNPAHPRHKRTSSGFSGFTNQYRFPSGLGSRLSSVRSASPSQAKLVHQPFVPTLVDELAVRCGESLTVLRSFDDGWCVVARDTSRHSRASILSVGMKNNGDNIDIGLIPAWAFCVPLEGIAPTRPFRSASLNALHFGQNSAHGRDWITSWSNFA